MFDDDVPGLDAKIFRVMGRKATRYPADGGFAHACKVIVDNTVEAKGEFSRAIDPRIHLHLRKCDAEGLQRGDEFTYCEGSAQKQVRVVELDPIGTDEWLASAWAVAI